MPGTDNTERIAIVGVGGIFPGAPDLATFWTNISAGIDAGRHVPPGRWYLSPEKAYAPWPPQPDRVYSTWGCFIEGFSLDPEGLDIEPDLLSRLDPMFHLGLHAARAAYRDARQLGNVDHSRVGVILGNIALPTESTSAICRDILGRTFVEKLIDAASAAAQANDGEHAPWMSALADPQAAAALKASLRRSHWDPLNRFAAGLPSSLIAQGLGLGGIAFTLDAACASSLYSLKFAAEELLAHRADAMLAGGMSRPDCQYTQMGFAQLQALSRRGCCAPLSAEADGLVVGEGAGVFVLKRLSDAVANGDHIYGVIAGIGLSNDRGANLLAPHSEGQLRAMRSAYEQAGWKPSDVDLIECHATGTPVGDAVEIASLHQLWEQESARPRQCVIGGVKSNVGHLLTGAGAAGLMKVLFALKHQTLPPTANFRQPAEKLAANESPFRVLDKSESWLRRTSASGETVAVPRRATINAFGFGGINAHVLIEEWSMAGGAGPSEGNTIPSVESNAVPIAVVGLDAHIGTWDSKQAVQESDFQAKPLDFVPLSWWGIEQSHWFHQERISDDFGCVPSEPTQPVGHATTEIRLPMGQFRIPPMEMQDMLPQQQMMLKVAAGALRDAELPRSHSQAVVDSSSQTSVSGTNDALSIRTGICIGIELDPNTTNFHFRWSVEEDVLHWATILDLDLSPRDLAEWTNQLKDAASPPLTPNRVMGNLGGIVASRLAREFDVGGPSFTVSSGAGSDVLAMHLAVQALQRGELDRAIVGAVELSSDPRLHAFPELKKNVGGDRSIDERNQRPQLEYYMPEICEAVILKRLDDATLDCDRCYAIIRDVQNSPSTPPQRTASIAPLQFSPAGGAHVAGRLLTNALFVYQGLNREVRYLENPAESDWSPGRLAPFIVRRKADRLKYSASFRRDSTILRIVFEEPEPTDSQFIESERRRPIGEFPFGVFVADGDSVQDLMQKLDELNQIAHDSISIEQLAIRWSRRQPPCSKHRLALTMIAFNADDLRSAIALGHDRLRGNEAVTETLTKQVFFSPKPLKSQGKVAFVFPGSGNAFRRMGRTLLSVFPQVLRHQQDENDDLPEQFKGNPFGPGRMRPEIDHKSMIFSQVTIGTAVCDLLALFGVRPSASIGYSLGESAALFGLRAWTDRDEMLQRMQQSTLFGSDLVEPFDAARKAWNVPEGEDVPWLSGIVDRSADEVRAAMQIRERDGSSRLYLLIVNTPRQCVIGGERGQLKQLVSDLNANFVPLASPSTVHCDVLRQVEGAYRELHLMRTTVPTVETERGPQPIDFYSAPWGRKYNLSRDSAAEAIVAQAVETIDFTRVIEQAYADGVRLFVEIGPGSSCTKMIGEILGDRPHLARSALPVTSRPVEAFFELLAELIAERVPVDLSYLYGQAVAGAVSEAPKSAPREVVTRVGGLPFQIPAPPGGWRFHYASVSEPSPRETDPFVRSRSVPYDVVEQSTATVLSPTVDVKVSNPDESTIAVVSSSEVDRPLSLWEQFQLMTDHRTQAHETFLRLSARFEQLAAEQLGLLSRLGAGVVEKSTQPPPLQEVTTGEDDSESATEVLQGLGGRGLGGRGSRRAATSIGCPMFDPGSAGASPSQASPSQASPSQASPSQDLPSRASPSPTIPVDPPRSLTREQCMEFAIGKIGRVLGQKFAEIDTHPTRVRLPDEPLMLVDRILTIEGEPLSMTSGRVVTEHDIHPGAWYLDCGRIPTCIAVESGQADLFLSGWLGIDFQTKGLACYRLLDAVVTFHDALPQAGKTIHYDIRVLHFFRQGSTYLFRFEFDATVDGRPLLTMREGCAGFFTDAELAGGKGVIHTALDKRPRPGIRPADWSDPVPMAVESYDDRQLLALRDGDLAACFGPAFAGLPVRNPVTLPGLATVPCLNTRERVAGAGPTGSPGAGLTGVSRSAPTPATPSPFYFQAEPEDRNQLASPAPRSRMWLIDRVLKLDPVGGKFGMGTILGELDIHPDDWFLTSHFCDDQVMPGTLMYECCLHTLRIYLLRMGWIGEAGDIVYEPIPGIRSRLKCRGQVLSSTRKVWYEVTLKEIGYGSKESDDANSSLATHHSPLATSPYCLADALMYADGKPIVEITDMSVRLTGLTKWDVEKLWKTGPRLKDRAWVAGAGPTGSPGSGGVGIVLNGSEGVAGAGPTGSPGSGVTGVSRSAPTPATPSTFGYQSMPDPRHHASSVATPIRYDHRPAIFDTDRITAFAIGNPSDAFGDRYRPFDAERKIARLPGPPFQFLDRIVSIQNCQPWVLQAGGEIVAQYDVPLDAWYFASNRQPTMPFAVLLETALQPCGWLAGYLGSALTSETDLSFRNLGGTATQFRDVAPQSGTLTTTVKMTRVSNSAGMIIQHYDFDLRCDGEPVYVGNTYFGFFSKAALSNQIGIREAAPYQPTQQELATAKRGQYPLDAPFPDDRFRMIQTVESLIPGGGPYGKGCIVGITPVDPASWFFKAHFYQDPVVPGSLGLESFWQLLKVFAADRWQLTANPRFMTPSLNPAPPTQIPAKHEWVYRGQVLPHDRMVTVTAVVREIDDARRTLTAEGFLSVDGRVIYQMKSFTIGCVH